MVERPEPAFRAHASSPHLPGDSGRVLNYLEMHLARRPDDLKGHTLRVMLAQGTGDADAIYGALVDLFIALAERGTGLKSTLLSRTVLLLGQPQRLFLARHLASGVRAEQPIQPPARRSVLTRGLVGTASLAP